MSKISVLIPTYKSVDALNLCIKSCVEGCYDLKGIEIIIGVDGTYEICKSVLDKWEKFINILPLDENVGLCRLTNLLVYNASNPLVLIVNDDNVFPRFWDKTLQDLWEGGVLSSPNKIEP
jgi:glycosyltransferase involved in cell wall biosynthesis